MKNFKKLLVLAFALVVAATVGISTNAEAARSFTNVKVTNTVSVRPAAENLTLAQWKKVTLKASSTPSVKPTFKSSNTKVASVNSSGVITAKSVGVAKITVRFAKSGYTTRTKTITVRVRKGKVTSVATSAKKTGVVGEKIQMKATVKASGSNPNKEVKWGSLNSSVAKVDSKSGIVTCIKPGTATIVAKSTDGTEKVARCTLTVKNKITSAALTTNVKKMYVGQKYYDFKAVLNSDAFNSLANLIVDKTESSNVAVATVARRGSGNNFTVTANKKGTLVLYVRSAKKNPDGKYKYSQKVTIKVVDKNVVKVEPKAGTTATATVTGTPKEIATDLEAALKAAQAAVNDITVKIDGVDKKVTWDGSKVMVGNTWLGDVTTTTGKVSVTITENFASYVQDMDVYAAFMDGKEYNYEVSVGNHKFTSLASDNGIYVTTKVDGQTFNMYNEGKTLYIVGTKAELGDSLVKDLEKVATLTDVEN